MDQAAISARNLTVAATFRFNDVGSVRGSVTIGHYAVNAGAESGQEYWPSRDVATFKNQSPNGKLFFRSMTGHLVDREFSGVHALGVAMSETDDFYACAATRYFEYFTGVKLKLYDPGDSANAEVANKSEREAEVREYVLALGKELRQTGSLKTLIRRILESDSYRQATPGKW